MTPVFGHGRLRLYLLKLLDEAPRHGYEVIRLLQDKFLGVYSPSPGTIYPRLARLEEEGLVTHDEVDGRKVYRITAKGREEIKARLDDLAELEEQLAESARGIAAGISRDVRDTVRSLREELGRVTGAGQRGAASGQPWPGAAWFTSHGREGGSEAGQPAGGSHAPGGEGGTEAGGSQAPGGGGGTGAGGSWGQATGSRPGTGTGGQRAGSGKGRGQWPDLERLAAEFARDIQAAATRAASLDERGLRDLRDILTEAMSRIRTEVFADWRGGKQDDGDPETPATQGDGGTPGARG